MSIKNRIGIAILFLSAIGAISFGVYLIGAMAIVIFAAGVAFVVLLNFLLD